MVKKLCILTILALGQVVGVLSVTNVAFGVATFTEEFDNPLDETLFTVTANPEWNTAGNFYGINNERYEFSSANGIGGSSSWRYSWLQYNPAAYGDFDISIDFTDFSPVLSQDYGYLMLVVDTDNGKQVRVERYTSGGGGSGFQNYRYIGSGTNHFGIGQITPAENSYGKLRLVRSGDDFLTYFMDGSGNYVCLGQITIADVLYSNLRIGYRVSSATKGFSVGVDNFQITYTPVPEPATLLLLGLGAMTLRRRK